MIPIGNSGSSALLMIQRHARCGRYVFPAGFRWFPQRRRTGFIKSAEEPEFSANFDRQASATDSVLFLGHSPPKANKTVSFFVSFHRGATPSGILFLFRSIEEAHAGFTTVVLCCLT